MANSRIVFILKRIPSMADPSINDVYPGEHFVTEDSGQLYYKDLQGIIVTVGGGKAAVPASWVYTPSAKNFTFNFEGSNFLEALEPFSSSIRFLTNANTVIGAGQNTITINITKNGSTLATRDFPIVDIIGRELRKASIPGNAICDILFDGTKFRVYNTYGFGSSTDDGSYFFDNNVVVDGSFSVINSNDKKGFVVLEDGTIVVGNDGVKLTNVTDLFQLKGNSTFDGNVNVTGKLTVGNRVYSSKGYDGILLSDIPTLDWSKLTNILPQDKVPAVTDNSNKIATTKWVADYIAYLGLTGGGAGGNGAVIDTKIQSTTATEGQTSFDFEYNADSLIVLSTGHVLVGGEDYTATDGTTIVFTDPCDADEELMFINIGKLDQEKYLTADQINAIITGSNFATVTYVQEQIDELIGGSSDALDTLKELADALNNDPDFATTITNQLAGKADKQHSHTWADITSGLPTATESKSGLIQLLTVSEAIKGTDTTKAMHAAGTRELIRGVGFNGFNGVANYATSTVLTKNSIGRWNRFNQPGIVVTLPVYTELDATGWSIVPIYNYSTGPITIKCPTPEHGFPTNSGIIQTITLNAYSSVFCVFEGNSTLNGESNWNMFGEGALAYGAGLKKVLGVNGYQVLPSGIIIQWGKLSINYANLIQNTYTDGRKTSSITGNGTYPIPFPTSCLFAFGGSNDTANTFVTTVYPANSSGFAYKYESTGGPASAGSNTLSFIAIGY
ncbi:putative minor tail protein [Yersinia phage phiR1-37]|uniref:putative minor tail protein n=1 Tax=Yersinia phage phiR1-37 TaxID=331278 RepID=UPI00022DBDD7|nr:putative minor tail protein [Yersinia phage phiR1-37]CCE26323.1 putative minor tail protein [Yersinia phage phiR1-37]